MEKLKQLSLSELLEVYKLCDYRDEEIVHNEIQERYGIRLEKQNKGFRDTMLSLLTILIIVIIIFLF